MTTEKKQPKPLTASDVTQHPGGLVRSGLRAGAQAKLFDVVTEKVGADPRG